MSSIVSAELLTKHRMFRLNTEVTRDASRTWCPAPGCHTICHVCPGPASPVTCHTCALQFCSRCHSSWHPGVTCADHVTHLENSDIIKRCPMCHVPIERDAGCAQMMCRRCKHVFCWYCMSSLDVSFKSDNYLYVLFNKKIIFSDDRGIFCSVTMTLEIVVVN